MKEKSLPEPLAESQQPAEQPSLPQRPQNTLRLPAPFIAVKADVRQEEPSGSKVYISIEFGAADRQAFEIGMSEMRNRINRTVNELAYRLSEKYYQDRARAGRGGFKGGRAAQAKHSYQFELDQVQAWERELANAKEDGDKARIAAAQSTLAAKKGFLLQKKKAIAAAKQRERRVRKKVGK